MDDGNNGHGNDVGGHDPSNPGQGNGNNGNGRPNNDDLGAAGPKSIANGVYDMSGKQVDLQYASSGMYLVIENGVVIRKVWK